MHPRQVFSGLLPHPPIVVPPVGGDRGEACRRTREACRAFARRLVAAGPARLVLVSPHAPRRRGALGFYAGARVAGDLGAFGAPRASVDLPNDSAFLEQLEAVAAERRLSTWRLPPAPLDHGAVVPLWFLAEAGWSGPTAVLSLSLPGAADLIELGRCVGESLERFGRSAALVASGDMTHRAIPGAPAGYDPRGVEFDRCFTEELRRGRLDRLLAIDPQLRAAAAEDATESVVLVGAALGFRVPRPEVLSYEHPFGVGYLVALFDDANERQDPPKDDSAGTRDEGGVGSALAVLPRIARESLRASFEGRRARLPRAEGELAERAPVFVTLRRRSNGELRGCVGSLVPRCSNLVDEVALGAIAAARRDPRFPPVRPEELDELSIEISVLGRSCPVADLGELDPRRYGVVVCDAEGRRGVLLPDLEGVDTVEQQVQIARRKAGIRDDVPVQIERFEVRKVRESEAGS